MRSVRTRAGVLIALLTMAAVLVLIPQANALQVQTTCNGANPTSIGTSGDDIIQGTEGDDVILAHGGDDIVYGNGGDDIICGGDGNDVLYGGDGRDLLLGEDGNDTLRGGRHNDRLRGGAGADTLEGEQGADKVSGGPDEDRVSGGSGQDVLAGGAASDFLHGGKKDDTLKGAKGNDELIGGPGNDKLIGAGDADACIGGRGDDTVSSCENAIAATSRLSVLDSCSAALEQFQAEALKVVGPYGLNGNQYFDGPGFPFPEGGPIPVPVAAPAAPPPTGTPVPIAVADAPALAATDAGVGSETNVQVAGVDEPDLVKTDGDRIYVVSNGKFTIVDAAGAASTIESDIDIDGYPYEMLINGDNVVLFSNDYLSPFDEVGLPVGFGGPVTRITKVNAGQNPPVITATLEVEGSYTSARMIDNTVRVVVNANQPNLPFLYPVNYDEASLDKATAYNKQVILDTTINDWIGLYTRTAGGVTDNGLVSECDQIHTPGDFLGLGLLSVLTFDITGDLTPGGGASVIADGSTVYASLDSLYVAVNESPWWGGPLDEPDPKYTSKIHRFSISDPTKATYEGSGEVRGQLLNQFSMHEYNDVFFIATTDGSPWWGGGDESESFVTSMKLDGNKLVEIDQVGNMGKGERIQSVRFVKDQGYVVTFRQVDPFYVIDMADPAALEVTGELKIPGFSSYLHPISEDLILGVGRDGTEDGQITGAKVSLFDVSDPTNPLEVAVWSEPGNLVAGWDHRAFLYWEPTNQAILPFNSWQTDFSGALVLEIGTDTITEVTRFEMDKRLEPCYYPGPFPLPLEGPVEEPIPVEPDDSPGFTISIEPGNRLSLPVPPDPNCEPYLVQDYVDRTLIAEGDLWMLSNTSLQAHNLSTFAKLTHLDFFEPFVF